MERYGLGTFAGEDISHDPLTCGVNSHVDPGNLEWESAKFYDI